MYQNLNPFQQKLFSSAVFFLKLMILSIPLYAILFFNINLSLLQYYTINNVAGILSLIGHDVFSVGFMLSADGSTFLIDPDCTPWKVMLLFFALVFATPNRRLPKRGNALIIGFGIIWAVNLIRIVASVETFFIYGLDFAMFAHDVIWQAVLIFLVLGMWVYWNRATFKRKKTS